MACHQWDHLGAWERFAAGHGFQYTRGQTDIGLSARHNSKAPTPTACELQTFLNRPNLVWTDFWKRFGIPEARVVVTMESRAV